MKSQFYAFAVEMPRNVAQDCSDLGPQATDVAYWSTRIPRPPEATPFETAAALLASQCWQPQDLASDAENWRRVVWLAATEIREHAVGGSFWKRTPRAVFQV